MLTLLGRLGSWARPRLMSPVWGSGLGLARTLLAAGTLGTLVFTDPGVLMSRLANGVVPPTCGDINQAGIWCLAPNLALGRWISVAVLLIVASGWRPRLTAIPHWYVSWSLIANATVQDGGDQITSVLTLLLIPLCLTDSRRWHWSPSTSDPEAEPDTRRTVGRIALLLIQIQVAAIYLHASIAKMGVPEWADGTAMYYWSRHPTFGAPSWLRPLMDLIVGSPYGVTAITWGSVALEFALAIAILLGPQAKRVLLLAGLLFHTGIAVHMGLVSFLAATSAGLLLALLPVGHNIGWPLWVRRQIEIRPRLTRPRLEAQVS
ncbi:MAG TPA: sporulation-delaying protein SdpB family protein [Candidatus Limnocylindrales bacterium]|nr:sporulation-delaying protein SdpB family protein [Candidatus Limnocylindrales bacterium]